MTYPDGDVLTNSYNDRMLLNSASDNWNGSTTNLVLSTNYDASSRITSRAFGNTLNQTFNYYAWNETALVDAQQVGQGGRLKNTTVGSIQNLSYVYDAVGNVRTIQDSLVPETQTYSYDTLDRLASTTVTGPFGYSEGYAYNGTTGNLTTKGTLTLGYTNSSHAHAVTSAGGNTYQYDANGNQTTRIIGADTYNLKYDAENRLVEVKKNNTIIAILTYDGDGKRVQSTINGTTTLFAGAGYEIKNPGTGQEISKYYFAGAQRIAIRKYTIPQNPTLSYLFSDHLGSMNVTTDANGAATNGMRYKAWGEVRYPTNGINPGPSKYTFTGQYSDSYINLLWYGSRHYDPELGRFISPDTIVPTSTQGVQAWDRYGYANNNPVRFTDPTGHYACGDGEEHDCNGHKQNPNQDPHLPKPKPPKPKDGQNNSSPDYKPCTALGINNGFCSVLAFMADGTALTLDALSLLISTVEAGTADAAILGALGVSIFIPEAAPGLIPGALGFDVEVATALGYVENPLGIYSTAATLFSDFLKGNTYISSEGDFYLGGNTIASAATTAVGLLPESNVDFAASAYIFGVDIGSIKEPASVNVSTPIRNFLTSFFPN